MAIDGKTLRRSHDHSDNRSAIHMVSAWATQSGLVLGQVKTAEKSNEMTAIAELLQSLLLEGCLITVDAMGCQKDIAKTIVHKKADSLLVVKDNQPKLKQDIENTLGQRFPKSYVKPKIDYCETQEKNRNRDEIRRCWVTQSISTLQTVEDWVGLTSIALVESERTINEVTSVERRSYISSCRYNAEEILHATRHHWGIENGLHWVLDMAFREDECRVRQGYGAENLARLRHIAVNLLKQDKTAKLGIKNKRLKAGWDQNYLLHLLSLCASS